MASHRRERRCGPVLVLGLVLAGGLGWPSGGWAAEEAEPPSTRVQARVRAGHPQQIAPWAWLSVRRHHRGYYLGGGAAFAGDPRDVRREGTWGWDYAPAWSRVRLRWWHGRRDQGGGGAYRSDGWTGLGRLGLFR